jgi:hypothetical protein
LLATTTLIAGGGAAEREAALAHAIDPQYTTVIVLEGWPGGDAQFARLCHQPSVQVIRIAPGCPCCVGNLTLRVTLNRILRHPPQRLYLGLATAEHLGAVCEFLRQAPYDSLLHLNQPLLVASNL